MFSVSLPTVGVDMAVVVNIAEVSEAAREIGPGAIALAKDLDRS
jgi:hypothetical protein